MVLIVSSHLHVLPYALCLHLGRIDVLGGDLEQTLYSLNFSEKGAICAFKVPSKEWETLPYADVPAEVQMRAVTILRGLDVEVQHWRALALELDLGLVPSENTLTDFQAGGGFGDPETFPVEPDNSG